MIKKEWFITFLLCTITIVVFGQGKKTSLNFFGRGVKLKEIVNGGVGIVNEGPAMSPGGLLFFTEVELGPNSGSIKTYDPANGKVAVFRSPGNGAGGMAFDAQGNLLIAEGANFGGRKITKTDLNTGQTTVVTDAYNGKKYNAPNDLTLDEQGRIYFTDSRYIGDEPIDQPVMGVYLIDLDGSVHLVAANATRPNGIAISPDQKKLYVGNYDYPGPGIYGLLPKDFHGPVSKACGDILVYDIRPDGNLKFNKRLVHFEGGGPDGVKVDEDENIYAIVSNTLYVYSPGGKKMAVIKIQVKDGFAANLCFGTGKYSKTLFISATKSIYRIDTKKAGYHIKTNNKTKQS